jgi:cytochrome c-type biogenesis protein CcmE
MDVKIKATVAFSVSSGALEDALAEYDELTVEGLLREVIDKAIAADEILAKVEEGPNTLEEYDQIGSQ